MVEKASKKRSPVERALHDERMNARRTVIEELFNDMYEDRRNIYVMNFFRGIFFGLGSVIGGTIIVALVVWILGFFVDFPGIGNAIEQTQDKLQNTRQR